MKSNAFTSQTKSFLRRQIHISCNTTRKSEGFYVRGSDKKNIEKIADSGYIFYKKREE